MEPDEQEQGEEREPTPLRRHAEERLAREKRVSLIAQLVVLVIGLGLLVYGLITYGAVAARLTRRAPQAALLPIAFGVGILYFGLRALAVTRQLRRRR